MAEQKQTTHPIEELWPHLSWWRRLKWRFDWMMRDPYAIFDPEWCKRMGMNPK